MRLRYGSCAGKDIPGCTAMGNYSANVVIQHSGCTYPETPSFSA